MTKRGDKKRCRPYTIIHTSRLWKITLSNMTWSGKSFSKKSRKETKNHKNFSVISQSRCPNQGRLQQTLKSKTSTNQWWKWRRRKPCKSYKKTQMQKSGTSEYKTSRTIRISKDNWNSCNKTKCHISWTSSTVIRLKRFDSKTCFFLRRSSDSTNKFLKMSAAYSKLSRMFNNEALREK